MKQALKTLLVLTALSAAIAACGIKGDPQPEKSTDTQQAQ